ncbi:MAG: hypothetical protein U0795_19285 [Pirellulales bacterium]
MFCSECGARAAGKFCSACGHKLLADVTATVDPDWEHSMDLAVVSAAPAVVAQVQQAKLRAEKSVNGEAWISLFDTLATPLTHGLSARTAAKILTPITSALGIRTTKTRHESFPLPPGVVLARILVSAAERGHTLTHVEQGPDSCQITANVPADLCAMNGTLTILVQRAPQGTDVRIDAVVEGQWYDWGKSERKIADLLLGVRKSA